MRRRGARNELSPEHLGSTNGTLYEGRNESAVELSDKSEFQVGATTLMLIARTSISVVSCRLSLSARFARCSGQLTTDTDNALNELSICTATRQLIAALTARDLKARYRGSILGFFWSLANPLLLLAVYTLVFTKFFPQQVVTPYPLFLFSGILPWTFFAAAVLESTTSISSNAGLIKKVMFPAEALPLVVVLSHLVTLGPRHLCGIAGSRARQVRAVVDYPPRAVADVLQRSSVGSGDDRVVGVGAVPDLRTSANLRHLGSSHADPLRDRRYRLTPHPRDLAHESADAVRVSYQRYCSRSACPTATLASWSSTRPARGPGFFVSTGEGHLAEAI